MRVLWCGNQSVLAAILEPVAVYWPSRLPRDRFFPPSEYFTIMVRLARLPWHPGGRAGAAGRRRAVVAAAGRAPAGLRGMTWRPGAPLNRAARDGEMRRLAGRLKRAGRGAGAALRPGYRAGRARLAVAMRGEAPRPVSYAGQESLDVAAL